ncbi:putative K domain-like, alpha/beta protein [Helianthus anomalus]
MELAEGGEKRRRIRELTSQVQKRFKFVENGMELYDERVNNRGPCAIAQAESLRYKRMKKNDHYRSGLI